MDFGTPNHVLVLRLCRAVGSVVPALLAEADGIETFKTLPADRPYECHLDIFMDAIGAEVLAVSFSCDV
jgi:hypothetical protein